MATGLFSLRQQLQAIWQKAWTGTQKTNFVEYLVVAGGGSGGGGTFYGSGGGGAGGLLAGMTPVVTGSSITVTVGAGGATAAGNAATNPGANSVFGSITAIGGGSTTSNGSGNGGDGGSGSGGGSGINFASRGGQGTSGQGNAGGQGKYASGGYGGGGGAGNVGLTGITSVGGSGGSGIASGISGTVVAYAGGGGGGVTDGANSGTLGQGGIGGGGLGGRQSGSTNNSNGSPGTANTGGGGGSSGGFNTNSGGAGGSGIVAISYPDVYSAPTSTTGSPTVSTSGSGSSYFNGSTWADYPASTSNYATGDFTIEAWVYYNAFTAGYTLWFSMDPNATYFGPTGATTTKLNLGTGGELSWTTSTISLNTWYHTAIVRSGTTITLYINGVSQGTNTSANTLGTSGGAIRIGNAVGYPLNGYLSNFRYTKSAVYTSAFTPSTAPLTALPNTRLLLNTVSPSPFNDSSGIAQVPTVTGTSSWNQLSPFATGSGYKNRVYTWTSSGSITF